MHDEKYSSVLIYLSILTENYFGSTVITHTKNIAIYAKFNQNVVPS